MQTLEFLATQPFLRGMPDNQLQLLANESLPVEFKMGELILTEGSPANRFYLITEGYVHLDAPISADESARVQTIGPGEVLGWSWLFPPYQWHFDARAATPVKAVFIYGTRLREMCDQNHDLGYALMQRISEIVIKRLQATQQELMWARKAR